MCNGIKITKSNDIRQKFPKLRPYHAITADTAFSMVMEIRADIEEKKKKNRMISTRVKTPSTTATSTTTTSSTSQQHTGFRKDYSLGEPVRSPSHMTIVPSSERATRAVNTLQKHDFAFVKRSDSSTYTYAILAFRDENSLVFVMCNDCSTKRVTKRYWSELVRLVSMEGVVEDSWHTTTNVNSSGARVFSQDEDREISIADAYVRKLRKQDSVPTSISIVPISNDHDDSSVVSDVSMPKFTRKISCIQERDQQ